MLHVTVGNESCDLDSMVSALAYAHHLSQVLGEKGVSVPFLQCRRADFVLRTEAVWLFKELKIDPSKLLFMEDLPPERMSSVRQLSLVLVDHHLPASSFQALAASITEAIDHHQKSGPEVTWKTTIEPVGSCCTLVAERLFAESNYKMEGTVASLLLAAILLDTANLSDDAGRVTGKDKEVAGRLSPLSSVPQDQLYQSVFKVYW